MICLESSLRKNGYLLGFPMFGSNIIHVSARAFAKTRLLEMVKRNGPIVWGGSLAIVLFLLVIPNALVALSPMGKSFAFDYFTWPRCGLAVRFGTNPFTSSQDYPYFGYFATSWVSHPMLCVLGGPLLSYLPPWTGFWLVNSLYCVLHVWILVACGRRIPRPWKRIDYIAFAAFGFFFPWYLLYVLGQYHAVVVWGLALVLFSERYTTGFLLSALGKPILGPPALVLVVCRKWRALAWIALGTIAIYLPFFILHYQLGTGLTLGWNPDFLKFFRDGSMYMRFSVLDWNQEMGWSKVFDEFAPPAQHLIFRYILAALCCLAGGWVGFKAGARKGILVATLWFFVLMGRGHEYHYSLYLPMLAFLYTDKRYRTPWFVFLCLLAALPTTFGLYSWIGNISDPHTASQSALRSASPLIFYSYLLQRPILLPLLIGTVIWKER